MKTRTEKNKKIQKEITREEHQKKIKIIVKIITIILVITFLILAYGLFIGAKVTLVNEYKITSDKVPNSFHGTKIVHISDLLFDSLNKNDLNNLKEKINKLEADLLVFTGDIKKSGYSLEKEDIDLLENFFKNLNSTIGKYAVIGDNDDDSFYVIMENSDFQVINNKQQILYNKDNNPINITGIDSNNINFENTENNDYYSICLFHNPDKVDEILKSTDCNLALAGDTLGGEIKVPFSNGIFLEHEYNKSYYKLNETEFYISNGLGNNYNIRLFNQPSINFYRLTKY